MRKLFAGLPIDKVVLGVVPLAMVAGTWFVATKTVDRLLYQDAVTAGRSWTSYLVDNVKDLEAIAHGLRPSADSQLLLEEAREDSQVFRYVIYDIDGRARYISDARRQAPEGEKRDEANASAGAADRENDDVVLGARNATAARAFTSARPLVDAQTGEPPWRPAYFAETYLPALANGKPVAVVETYVDQTEKRDEYGGAVVLMGTALLALIGVAFGIPALGWLKRSNEQRLAEAHIHFLAHHDSLTGLINRGRLTDDHASLFGLSKPNQRLALHHVDIDHFKNINDTLGHDAGDMLIIAVAQRLKAMAKPHDLIARVGGDEFVLVQTLAPDERAIGAFAGEMRRWLSQPYDLNGHAAQVTVSIGVAFAPTHGDSIAQLMKSADLAVYHSKAAGRNTVSIYSADMERELAERLRLERAIRDALAVGAFELLYQPAVEMPGGRLVGFEALLRMREESDVPPSIFIPLAEHIGLIDKIGEWVLREACRVAKNWPDDVKIAVNLSPAQFARAGLASRVAGILAETGLEAGRLELEITEGLLLSRSEEVMGELRRLKAEGVSIVMDDFGTGYSSLSYLWQFPFDKIKIDRAFMLGLDAEDPRNAEKIVRTIIDLGRSLNVTVTVEGVENERQLAFVREARCDQVQGFYFGRPMPAWDVGAYMAKNRLATMAETEGLLRAASVA
jgi:diguanylate cyclase (GGDEF)-like protein